jgi:GT2 family glycosyltransferase
MGYHNSKQYVYFCKSMDASIIIPLYQRTNWIVKTLKNLQEQDFQGTFEVVVVDDGSPNETEIRDALETVPAKNAMNLRHIKNRHAGPAAARNYGVQHASGKILLFLDDDSVPERTWLKEMMRYFHHDNPPAIVSGLILSYDRQKSFPLLLEKAVYSGKHWATCNISYRKDVFEKLGGFDETFPESSWEDNDLGIRAKWAGYKHVYNRNAIVYHNHENTFEQYKKKCQLNGRGAAVFSRKYFLKKPLWGIATPFFMSRRIIYGLHPAVWVRKKSSPAYVKFIWSYYSLVGFTKAFLKERNGKN